MLLGADGYIPSMAPLFPEPHIRMYEYGRKGDIANTMACNDIISEISAIWPMTKSQTASTKYAISRLGFCDKRVIRPTEPILPDEEKRIDAKIDEIWKLIKEFREVKA